MGVAGPTWLGLGVGVGVGVRVRVRVRDRVRVRVRLRVRLRLRVRVRVRVRVGVYVVGERHRSGGALLLKALAHAGVLVAHLLVVCEVAVDARHAVRRQGPAEARLTVVSSK